MLQKRRKSQLIKFNLIGSFCAESVKIHVPAVPRRTAAVPTLRLLEKLLVQHKK
jgi:hypothetical protein